MNSFLVGFVVFAVTVFQASCDPAGVSDRCKIPYVADAQHNKQGTDFVGLQISVSYYCLPGYYIDGYDTLVCHPYGFDHPPPVCKPEVPINQCKYQIKELEYGLIDADEKDYYNPGERIWYFCFEPYVLEGAQDVTCLPTGQWNYPAPTCVLKFKQCLRRSPPDNGSQDPDQPKYQPGDPVYYACDEPYVLKGAPTAFCAPNGLWTHPVPTCEEPTCPPLQAPANGFLSPSQNEYSVGAMVFFRCFKHYELKGFPKLICLPTGEWNYPEPSCEAITCPPLEPPVYGSLYPIQDSYSAKDRITFDCNDNYVLVGSKQATCLSNGAWSDDVPHCIPEQCDKPVIDYGSFLPYKNAYDVGDYVTFHCNDGFLLQGSVYVIHCLSGGKWSDDFPICRPIQCERPFFENGSLEEDKDLYDVDEYVAFTCDMGYVIDGPKTLKCLSSGGWSGNFPVCNPVFCDRPTLENGELIEDQDAYAVGEMVTFVCNEGYTRVGLKKVTCRKTGEWSGDFPTCEPNMCDRPFINDGSFEDDKDSYAVDEMVTFFCDNGFTLQGLKKVTCQSNSEWSDPFPVCIPNLCERPFVDYGILAPDQEYYQVHEMVVITCEKGFALQGAPKLTCLGNGKFNYPPPTCEPVSCPRPIFENGILDEDKSQYDPHDYVVFVCNRGFELSGPSRLKCGLDGEWSDDFPTCDPIKCLRPSINNGMFKPPKNLYHVDDIVTFRCQGGYVLKGSETITCEDDGGWSDEFPICKKVTCTPTPDIENGRFEDVQAFYVPGDMVKFFCNRNFFLVGQMKINCLNNGEWSDDFPTCQEYVCPVPVLENGFFQPEQNEYFLDEKVNFVCNDGYTLVGRKKIICEEKGEWSDDFPTCEPNQCRRPFIDDGSFTPDQNLYEIDDVVDFECDMGFNLVGVVQVICESDGDWSDEFPNCAPVTCPRPVVSDGVSFTPSQNEYHVGQDVTFNCRRGTTLVGAEVVECLKTGEWSDDFPTCEPNQCVQPVIDDGSFSPFRTAYDVDDKVTFDCNDGFNLNGEEIIRCLSNGEWSDDFPTCERVFCLPNPEINDGTFEPIQNVYYYLDDVTFSCNDGFSLQGLENIKCLRNGQWSAQFPICHPNQCEPPVQNDNIVSIIPSQGAYDVGDEVTFRCRRGFKLVGSDTSVCQSDQTWSPVEPTCMKIVICRQPTRPRYSIPSPNKPTYQVGDSITYKCRDKFELKGEPVITCQDDGNFDRRPPTCQRPPAKCRRPYTPRKLSITPDEDYYNPGDVIVFECADRYTLDGDSTVTCLTNGRWSSYIPSCVYGLSKSCKSRCDEVWGRGQPCQCNKYCRYFDRVTQPKYACCHDYHDYCKH